MYLCDAFCDLVPFVQFEKREKHPWRSFTFSKVTGFYPAALLKVALLHGCFSHFLNCTNGTKSHKTSMMVLRILSFFDQCFINWYFYSMN